MKASLLILAGLAPVLHAQDATQPPATAQIAYTTQGVGVQIYVCQVNGSESAWKLQEPQADLLDATSHAAVGTHSKGPTWTWKDGSTITGKLLQQQPSPDAANIPWLLLQTTSTGTQGALSTIAYVRRSNTEGGIAPTSGCSQNAVNTTTRVPYKATYTFYRAKK